jgi:hypothetical protein
VTLSGATGGTYTLSYNGVATAAIAYNATNSTVQSALTAIPALTGNVTVTGSAGGPWTCTFGGGLANVQVYPLVPNAASLTGTSPTCIVATTTFGSANHTKVSDVVISDVDLNGNATTGSIGLDLTVAASVGTHEYVYYRKGTISNVLGNVVRGTNTLTGGAGPNNIGLIGAYLNHLHASSAGHTVDIACLSFLTILGCTLIGGNGNETNDHHLSMKTVTAGTPQMYALVRYCGIQLANKKNVGINIPGGWMYAYAAQNYITGVRTGISVDRDPADLTRELPCNVLIEGNRIGYLGLSGYSQARGVYQRAAVNVLTRNNLFYENGFANGTAQAVGADIEIDDASGQEVQAESFTVTTTGSPSSGGFILKFDGQSTASIAYNASAATFQSAMQALSRVGPNVTVTGSAGGPWTVTFSGNLATAVLPSIKLVSHTMGVGKSVSIVSVRRGTGPIRIGHNSFYRSYARCAAPHVEIDDIRAVYCTNNAFQYMGSGGSGGTDPARKIIRFTSLANVLPPTNETQTVTIGGSPTGGTFTLSWTGTTQTPVPTETTGTIAYNASAATVQTAIAALPSVGTGNVAVTGSNGGPWTITLQGTLARTRTSVFAVGTNSLTPSGTITIAETVQGGMGSTRFDGNCYNSPNLVVGSLTKPFALSSSDIVEFDAASGADWRNVNTPSGANAFDVKGQYITSTLGFRNPGAGNFRFNLGDPLVDGTTYSNGTIFDVYGNTRTTNPDPGAYEFTGGSTTGAYSYQPAPLSALPTGGAWNYNSGDIRHIESGEPVRVTHVTETDVDGRPHRHLAHRDNILGASIDGVLADINAAFCSSPQSGSAFTAPHTSIASFLSVSFNPDGTLRSDVQIDLGFLRVDGSNAMLAPLNFGGFAGVNLGAAVLPTDVPQFQQVISVANADTKNAELSFKMHLWDNGLGGATGTYVPHTSAPTGTGSPNGYTADGVGINMNAAPLTYANGTPGVDDNFNGRYIVDSAGAILNAYPITQDSGNKIYNLAYPTRGHHATNKKYVDDGLDTKITAATPYLEEIYGTNFSLPKTVTLASAGLWKLEISLLGLPDNLNLSCTVTTNTETHVRQFPDIYRQNMVTFPFFVRVTAGGTHPLQFKITSVIGAYTQGFIIATKIGN